MGERLGPAGTKIQKHLDRPVYNPNRVHSVSRRDLLIPKLNVSAVNQDLSTEIKTTGDESISSVTKAISNVGNNLATRRQVVFYGSLALAPVSLLKFGFDLFPSMNAYSQGLREVKATNPAPSKREIRQAQDTMDKIAEAHLATEKIASIEGQQNITLNISAEEKHAVDVLQQEAAHEAIVGQIADETINKPSSVLNTLADVFAFGATLFINTKIGRLIEGEPEKSLVKTTGGRKDGIWNAVEDEIKKGWRP